MCTLICVVMYSANLMCRWHISTTDGHIPASCPSQGCPLTVQGNTDHLWGLWEGVCVCNCMWSALCLGPSCRLLLSVPLWKVTLSHLRTTPCLMKMVRLSYTSTTGITLLLSSSSIYCRHRCTSRATHSISVDAVLPFPTLRQDQRLCEGSGVYWPSYHTYTNSYWTVYVQIQDIQSERHCHTRFWSTFSRLPIMAMCSIVSFSSFFSSSSSSSVSCYSMLVIWYKLPGGWKKHVQWILPIDLSTANVSSICSGWTRPTKLSD